ncbi:YceI family protein [Brevundimonas sp.]|uniref:YceI family protein n=1 Tax=Brevundimonas sp. TaxID=1871086 RepID=UPI002BE5599B|nr:YceI family protein [Brevundimonas sp.]HWQ86082.1 YceI family protein [Brevundimonas sp.]
MRLLAALLVVLLTPLLTGAAPGPWTFDRDVSRIEMSVRAFGGWRTGRFEDWRGSIVLDPAQPEAARASVTVQAASLRMSPAVATRRAVGPAFLDAARHPLIRFELKSLERLGADRYTAHADITMKGRTRSVAFPLDLRISGERAHLAGALTLDRADFGIGTSGPWDRLVGRQVTVRVALQARPA